MRYSMRYVVVVALAFTSAVLGVKCIISGIVLKSIIWWALDHECCMPESKSELKPYVSKVVDHMVRDFLRCMGR